MKHSGNETKGKVFDGFFSGVNYDRFAGWYGYGPALYRKIALAIPFVDGMRVLDLGCGTGNLSFAARKRVGENGEVCGVDLSQDQLDYAESKKGPSDQNVKFVLSSMDEVPFRRSHFDAVITGMAMHVVPPDVRRAAIKEASRVLKKDGIFALVDWSKPRVGRIKMAWRLFLGHGRSSEDNWNNTYPDICRENGLRLLTDTYLNTTVRCQIFYMEASRKH